MSSPARTIAITRNAAPKPAQFSATGAAPSLASTYYYDDWRSLGINRPPPGRRWVRYGPDLVLVNLRNRRVEDVIYDVFY